jgi:hypothetical protein
LSEHRPDFLARDVIKPRAQARILARAFNSLGLADQAKGRLFRLIPILNTLLVSGWQSDAAGQRSAFLSNFGKFLDPRPPTTVA